MNQIQLLQNMDSEIICEYEVTEKMKKIWNVELNILVEFQRICQKYDLTYYAIGGTLLGAIRHKGFIPWDDDIDVGMPRKDYEIFCDVALSELKPPLFLQTYKTEKTYTYDFAKIRNSDTTGFTIGEGLNKMNKGIFIDILPIDHEPDDEKLCKAQNEKHRRQMHLISATSKIGNYKGIKGVFLNLIRRFLMVIIPQSTRVHWLDKLSADVSKYNDIPTEYCGLRSFWSTDRIRWRNEDCAKFYEVPFEKIRIMIPNGYDSILRRCYGDYMVFVRGGSYHDSIITFEPDIPYEIYCREHNLVV